MHSWTLLALFLSTGFTLASPPPGHEERAVNCVVVNSIINYFTRYTSQASSFCSAYLQTSTTVTTTVPTRTTTITVGGGGSAVTSTV